VVNAIAIIDPCGTHMVLTIYRVIKTHFFWMDVSSVSSPYFSVGYNT